MSQELARLTDYVDAAGMAAQQDRESYYRGITRTQQYLQQLSLRRQGYFSQRDGNNLDGLKQQHQAISDSLQQLRALPRLGIYEEQEAQLDTVAAMLGWNSEKDSGASKFSASCIAG